MMLTTSPNPEGRSVRPVRLEYLDGLRAVTALYVVLFHLWGFYQTDQTRALPTLPPPVWRSMGWMAYGRDAVSIFIVLSGFCLMLPVARSGELRGGTLDFFRRRARRILPPYYAALLGIPLIHLLRHHAPFPMTSGAFLSHLFLVHNWFPQWKWEIDAPLWSVASEWQIYFFFPLFLLPLWRRFGLAAAVAAAFAIGLAPHFWLRNGDLPCPWYLGLFALGAAGAVVAYSPQPLSQTWLRRVPWGVASGVLALLLIFNVLWPLYRSGLGHDANGPHFLSLWQTDVIVGLATACLLIHGAGKGHHASLPINLLSRRGLVAIGTFSYSLYLIHLPVLGIVLDVVLRLRLGGVPTLLLFFASGLVGAIAVSYGFFLAFERPFLVKRVRETPAETARDAALSPAP